MNKRKKTLKKGIISLFTILLVSAFIVFISAQEIPKYPDTHIYGAVYYQNDPYKIVKGANINVSCFHENESYMQNVLSTEWSDYYVLFTQDECAKGDLVTVEVTYKDVYGHNSGYVNRINDTLDDVLYRIDVAIIDVPLVPEFSLIIGSLTIASAVALFFVIRKK